MTIEIVDKRNTNLIPLGNLCEGDTFVHLNNLWLILRDQNKESEFYRCVHLGRENNGHVSELSKSTEIQQVSVVVHMHLV